MRRGEIWWASLGMPVGSGPGYRRPVLIVSSDEFNRSRIGTVTVVALTSNLEYGDLPGNVVLSKRVTRLPKSSVANVTQVATVDRSALRERVSRVPARLLHRLDEGLRLALGLGGPAAGR